jgi:hypothetical protein
MKNPANSWIPTPEYFGFSKDVAFIVTRAGRKANKTASFSDVVGFLEACGVNLNSGEVMLEMAFLGVPIEIDDAVMQFTVV